MKKPTAFSYLNLFLLLFIKVIAFRVLIFDTKSVVTVAFIEFPMWALLFALVLLAVNKRVWLTIWIYNFLVSVIFFTVTLYIRYYSTIPSYYDLQQTTQSGSVGNTIMMLSNPFDFLFFLDAILVLIFARKWAAPAKTQSLKYAAAGLALLCAATTGYALKQPLIDVSYFAKENGYLQSQLVQVYHRSNETAHASTTKLSPKQLEALKGNEYVELERQKAFGLARDRHLFVIQVESLQNFVIGKSLNGQEITPHLNELLSESAYFPNVFQQIGAGTTSDAEWIVNTGLYPQGMIPTVNSLNGKAVPSLPRTLQKHGYGSATYHADEVTFWNRDVLYPVLGYDEVYSTEEIPNIKPVGFGPADEVVFDFAADKLQKQLKDYERIYSNIVTVTSHTPFIMPENMQGLDLPAEYEDMYVGNYLQAIHYTDAQIGAFIEELRSQGLYDESLIVILGDHSGMHGSLVTEQDELLLENFIGHPYTIKDQFTIPLLFTGGDLFYGIQMEQLGGQVDIMPTILALLGIDHENPMMGHNLFQYEKNLLGMRYYLPGGSFIQSEQIYKAPGARMPEVLYDMKSMEPRGKNSEAKKHIRDTDTLLDYGDLLLKPYLED
ncbi:LTA synthase family protein [Planomicrobium sp. CPCC 101079]|uniref:LTA synthase family protein n=1 Tax=Planomicrobium sp. CPCC 101079 TaxID=2599618 RepID=UPI0011B5FA01|nr:LTA synthase family protein [Planomicrobium sp. CPCC 101079]TWT16040.1 LTA synthase family protein [Planomicrobium sp. CPCC 101079]